MSLDKDAVKAAANDQWADVLQAVAGLEDMQVTLKKDCHCPVCGGTDRYTFKDSMSGGWACRNCGGGDGLKLVELVNGVSFDQAVNQVGNYLGMSGQSKPDTKAIEQQKQKAAARTAARQEKAAMRLEKDTERVVAKWEKLDYCTGNEYSEYKRFSTSLMAVLRQSGKCISAPIYSPDGQLVSLQDFPGTKDDKGRFNRFIAKGTATKGGFLKWGEYESLYILIGEGLATVDAGFQLAGSNRLAVCAYSASQLPSVAASIREQHPQSNIVILADRGEAGIRYATKTVQQVPGSVAVLPPSGDDWSDYFLAGGQESPVMVEHMDIADSAQPENLLKPAIEAVNDTPEQADTINGKALAGDELDRLNGMNNAICHTVAGGRHVIARNVYCPITGKARAFEPVGELHNYYRHSPPVAGMNAGKAWLQWPGKNHKLGGITFQPDERHCPDDVMNLWTGFNVEPAAGDVGVFLGHLREIICANDEAAFDYLIGWLAHMIQRPAVKPSVAVFMRSVQGAGKDTMVKAVAGMLGQHAVTLNGQRQATGRFQGAIQEKLFVFINEAQITNNRDVDALKGLITEDSVSLELKGKDPVRIPNYARFIFASNHDHVILADPKERRYLMLEPFMPYDHGTPEYHAYFDRLHKWIDGGGSAKLLAYLQGYDLTGFNPHAAPATKLLNEQKQLSMKPVHQWLMEWLSDGEGDRLCGQTIAATKLSESYRTWTEANTDSLITRTRAGREIKKALQEMGIQKFTSNGVKYTLPDLQKMRARFAGVFKVQPEEMF